MHDREPVYCMTLIQSGRDADACRSEWITKNNMSTDRENGRGNKRGQDGSQE
jgi:hypothetical protein